MASSDRHRQRGALHLVSTFLASFPPTARLAQERQLASLPRVREDGSLIVRVERDGRGLTILALGELDIASSKLLEEELVAAFGSGSSDVVLDLSGISFIDSTGLRVLLIAVKLSATNGTALSMVDASEPVREVIEVSGLKRSLPLAA
jgi:anti-sigma B factor antagonist